MKKNLLYLFLILSLGFSIASCEKEHGKKETKYVTLDVILARGANYQLDLSAYGDADDLATIITQATDYTISEIVKNASTSKYLYNYTTATTPKFSSTGKDQVVLKVYEEEGERCRDKGEATIITINFTLQ